jgi:hypothetical protein
MTGIDLKDGNGLGNIFELDFAQRLVANRAFINNQFNCRFGAKDLTRPGMGCCPGSDVDSSAEKLSILFQNRASMDSDMNRLGSSGYWDITVNLPSGEHRFTYILDGKKRFTDPTVPARELDDFGGRNSIISVESKT